MRQAVAPSQRTHTARWLSRTLLSPFASASMLLTVFDPAREQLQPELDGPCTCGSGKLLRSCCWNGTAIVAAQVRIRERTTLSYRNPRCYASHRWKCSSKLSGEHWLSKSVLSAFVRGD